MNIAHILTRGDVFGGAQSHVRDLTLELRRLGHEVTVITGAPGVFTDQLRQVEIPCLQVRSLVRPLQPHRDVAAFLQLSSVLCHLKPDVLCAHTAKAGSLGRAVARLLDIPCVFTPHGWSMFDRNSLKWNPLFYGAERLAGRLGARVINVCDFERQFAEKCRVCPTNKLEVVHSGIAEIPMTRINSLDTQPPLIVMVARFAAQKDHSTLLQALSGLLCLKWSLLLVGAGELEPQVMAQVAALGLSDRVRILPPETNIARLLMEAQIYVLSTHFEALPISILEAMRAGLPVVATDVGGISESVRNEETGLLARYGDVGHLRDALAQLIAHPALRRALGAAGHRLWSEQFTASTMAARTIEVYNRARAN
jgi:glycosyltransferase involved in cell wall biosynthesis